MPLGIVCGFQAEAKIARKLSPLVAMGWQNPAAAQQLIERGATALLSFGLAGALAPALKAGDLVIPETICTASGERFAVDAELRAGLVDKSPHAHGGILYADAAVVASVAEKRRLYETTGALALDMESGHVARAAQAAGIPFSVLRAISDPADFALPPAALVGLKADGGVDYRAIAGSILKDPLQIKPLIKLAKEARQAYRSLKVYG